ncbi:hypothetical protein CR513_28605, partial [Mucuna pruriens]
MQCHGSIRQKSHRHPKTTVPEITNIAGARGMTWSRRIFALEALRSKDLAPTKKERIVEPPKRMVTDEEAHEFFKIIQHSEYEMLDQLHKTPVWISLLSLLINSKSHWELLLKILNKAHVPQHITPAKFEGIINNITTSCHLSFSEEEVPIEVWKLHDSEVLKDNGSSLNVMLKTMLDKLYSPGIILRNSPVVVRAFDGSKREVMGEITLPICIGPTTFDITFQEMDIRPAYSCLLGRPWIHAIGAVPSSLHEKVKFIANG